MPCIIQKKNHIFVFVLSTEKYRYKRYIQDYFLKFLFINDKGIKDNVIAQTGLKLMILLPLLFQHIPLTCATITGRILSKNYVKNNMETVPGNTGKSSHFLICKIHYLSYLNMLLDKTITLFSCSGIFITMRTKRVD